MKNFLYRKNDSIYQSDNKVVLKGVNLGGWLLMEAYLLYALHAPEKAFKNDFKKKLSKEKLKEFEEGFRKNFITKKDIEIIAGHKFNCIRVPFHYKIVESKPFEYKAESIKYLDRVIRWAKANKLWVILDLHAACGSQNNDWHSDSSGEAKLWKSDSCRRRTVKLWGFLADRYRNEESVAGYDILNEAVLDDHGCLNVLYTQIIKEIRKYDSNHIIFVEGNKWATDIKCLDYFDDENCLLSIHSYEPMNFAFNLTPQTHFKDVKCDLNTHLSRYAAEAKKRNRPVFVGEFGVNYRENLYGEVDWLNEMLKYFEAFGFHWTYWTYKAVKNSVFPDGIYSYYENPAWVNRGGSKIGWDTYADLWVKNKTEIKTSWRTENFKINKEVIKSLKNYV